MNTKCRKTTIAIVALAVGLLVSISSLIWVSVQNWSLKLEAKMLASDLGFNMAREDYVRGRYILLEVKPFKWPDDGPVPNDGGLIPTGRREGRFQIFSLLVGADHLGPHLEIQQTYVDAYNQHMRHFFDHPEWFDTNGYRVSGKNRSQNPSNSVPKQ